MPPTSFQFESVLLGEAEGPTGIQVPAEVIESMQAGKKPAVALVVNGYAYRSTVFVMGGDFMVPFSSEHRKNAGLKAGDKIAVQIAVDTEPRTVEVPEDLARALESAGLTQAFDKLSYTHRKEHVRAINEAKAPETRIRRIEKAIEKLSG